MKRIWNILFFAYFISCLVLFRPRQDVVFTAIEKAQYIKLFETGQDFELCVEENNIFTGTYALSKDTVFLMYRNTRQAPYTRSLPKKLIINKRAYNIKSTDDLSFSAEIHMDMRQKLHESQNASILAAELH